MKAQVESRMNAISVAHTRSLADWVLATALAIQAVPAPTFHEAARADLVARYFHEFQLRDTQIDALANVLGRMPGSAPGRKGLMIMAHTDTVFPAETPLAVTRVGDRLAGPGLGDNSIGVAGLLGILRSWAERGAQPAVDVWFVATSREEGLGNLDGVRAALAMLADRVQLVINIEGMLLGHVYDGGIAVDRYRVRVTTPGGHSWADFGQPSAIHIAARIIADFGAVRISGNPRTTYNVGTIEGGRSVNTIAEEAVFLLDVRSESQDELDHLVAQFSAIVARYGEDAGIRTDFERIGHRPSGAIGADHPLLIGAVAALAAVDLPAELVKGSTDGNIPLAMGIPTVTVGVTRGAHAHRTDEYIETGPIPAGMHQILGLVEGADDWLLASV
jgi:tripeptide aminopeptidase